jgi:hypothetical protein
MGGYSRLVVVDDFYVFRSFISPDEAHPKLIVDPDRMLPITIPAQSLKPIPWRRAQIIQVNRSVKIRRLNASSVGICASNMSGRLSFLVPKAAILRRWGQ